VWQGVGFARSEWFSSMHKTHLVHNRHLLAARKPVGCKEALHMSEVAPSMIPVC